MAIKGMGAKAAMTSTLWNKVQTKEGWEARCDVKDGLTVKETAKLYGPTEKALDDAAAAFKAAVEAEKASPKLSDHDPCSEYK